MQMLNFIHSADLNKLVSINALYSFSVLVRFYFYSWFDQLIGSVGWLVVYFDSVYDDDD